MNPLDATTPRELFGDAVDDPRALKRAYARLIKEFGPESAPDAFRHIRTLYEAAAEVRSVEVAAEVRPVEAAAPAPVASAVAIPQLLDELGLDGTLAALDTRALAGDVGAARAAIALTVAGRPTELTARLTRLAGHERLGTAVVEMVQMLLWTERIWADAPGLADVVDLCPARIPAAQLAVALVQTWVAWDDADRAWAGWRRWEALIQLGLPERWFPLLVELLHAFGWDLATGEVDAWITRAGAERAPVSEAGLQSLRGLSRWIKALRYATSFATPAELRLLRGVPQMDPAGRRVSVGLIAGMPGLDARLATWTDLRPELAAYVEWRIDQASQRDGAVWAAQGGEVIAVPAVDVAPLRAFVPQDQEVERATVAARAAFVARREALLRLPRIGMVGVVVAAVSLLGLEGSLRQRAGSLGPVGRALLAVLEPGGTSVSLTFVWLAVGAFIAFSMWGSSRAGIRADAAERLNRAPWLSEAKRLRDEAGERVLAWCREQGIWLHEAAFALGEDGAVLDTLLLDPRSDLRVVGVANVRRALSWEGT